MVYSESTFQRTLILFNKKLQNLYIYDIKSYNPKSFNCKVHIMKPSKIYLDLMKGKWNKTKEQLSLMINENCINDNLYTYFPFKKRIK